LPTAPISRRWRSRRSAAKAAPSARTGDGLDPIIVHPDVKRMLLQMRAMTAAARSICYATAVAMDVSVRGQGRQGFAQTQPPAARC